MRALALGLCLFALPVQAGQTLVAVATNFRSCAGELGALFRRETGREVAFSAGSTGKLYAQLRLAAPFDVFLAADRERPRRLIEQGLAVAGSQRTYALGRLLLWSPGGRAGASWLREAEVRHLALAKPELAPYGLAAVQVLAALGLEERLRDRLVYGENIGQTFALVYSGGAEAGFLALAQRDRLPGSEYWLVPEAHHEPIRQDLVLLQRGAGKPAALAFIDFLQSDAALAVIRRHGYQLPGDHE